MPKRRFGARTIASLMVKIVVIAAPTSTTKMTGFFATTRGLSLTNESRTARLSISGSDSGRARAPFERIWPLSGACLGVCDFGGDTRVDISIHLPAQHLKMLDDWTQRDRW